MTVHALGLDLAQLISIHMPHTWHDPAPAKAEAEEVISIHMPHTWHDPAENHFPTGFLLFQSTCHIRGMTCCQRFGNQVKKISIHMPHTWHDLC